MKLIKCFFASVITLLSLNIEAQTYISATGGTISTDGDYKVHTFTSSGTFTVTNVGSIGTVQYLVVAGGGGGGTVYPNAFPGSGGGAGGLLAGTGFTVSATSYNITVGAGGASGNSGGNSVFSSLTAIGGGGGAGIEGNCVYYTAPWGCSGGSGGGGIYVDEYGGAGTVGQGNAGAGGGQPDYYSGGGGGAGAIGGVGGVGGSGIGNTITGNTVYYCGGGAGAYYYSSSYSNGGIGGGGNSGNTGDGGTANTGGGGGGGGGGAGGAGGSGIVIIKYRFQNSGGTTTSSQWITSGNNIYNANTGSVGIGTGAAHMGDAAYKLFVATGIRTEKLKVDVPYSSWPDYVFDKDYKLPSLEETEKFIKLNQHLPGLPSAKEVEKNGIDVGNNQALLLKKIEELTLLLIEQNKKIEKLDDKIRDLGNNKIKNQNK